MKNSVLDQGWVDLMKEAKSLGLTTKEVHQFFQNHKKDERSLKHKEEKPVKNGFSSTFESLRTP